MPPDAREYGKEVAEEPVQDVAKALRGASVEGHVPPPAAGSALGVATDEPQRSAAGHAEQQTRRGGEEKEDDNYAHEPIVAIVKDDVSRPFK